MNEQRGETERGRVAPTKGVWYDRVSGGHDLAEASVVELHLSFGGKTQVSALPDNTGFLIRTFPPGAPHEEGGDNWTDLSVVIRYDEQLKTVVEKVSLLPRVARTGGHNAENARDAGAPGSDSASVGPSSFSVPSTPQEQHEHR